MPDTAMPARMMLSGDSSYAIGMICGVGGRANKFEQHRYGYTCGMLIEGWFVDETTPKQAGDREWRDFINSFTTV